MGNLGFHPVNHLVNLEEDVVCERATLEPGAGGPLTIESGRPLSAFEIVAFSISYETDVFNLAAMLSTAGIPLSPEGRAEAGSPLVLVGGVIAFLNPEPLAPLADVMAIGEAEPILPDFLAAFRASRDQPRPDLLRALAQVPGLYVPSLYQVRHDASGQIRDRRALDNSAPATIARRVSRDLLEPARTRVFCADAEFSEMALVELGRGCPHACRFCAGSYLFRPPRWAPLPALQSALKEGFQRREVAGLVSASATDHPEFPALCQWLRGQGKKHSLSSLRLDQLTPALLAEIKASGHKTLTLAPEAGTERLRRVLNKPIRDREIVSAMEMVGVSEIKRLKLYFQVGLPFETGEDVAAIPELVAHVKKALAQGGGKKKWPGVVSVSINPFVPKPGTPFQWHPMPPMSALKAKLGGLTTALRKLGGITVSGTPVREALVQGLLARGDRRIGERLAALVKSGGRISDLLRAPADSAPSADWFIHRPRPREEILPWDFLDHGASKDQLWKEYEKARLTKITPPCRPGSCRLCAACELLAETPQ